MSRRKMSLDVSALEVETFSPATPAEIRGTVHGHSGGTYCYHTCNCANDSAPNYGSCGTTCQDPTNCFSYCTNENCVESNVFSCGCPAGSGGGTCNCTPSPTSREAGCNDH